MEELGLNASLRTLPARLHVDWTEPYQLLPAGHETGDPLGLRAAAARWAPALVPVFTRQCSQLRRLSLFTLCLQVAGSSKFVDPDPKERFLRCERLWVLAHARDYKNGPTFAGIDAARHRLDVGEPYDISGPLLSSQLASGLWGQCRRPAAQLGFIIGRRGGPERWRPTEHGLRLALATRDALSGDGYAGSAVASTEVSAERLAEVFRDDGDELSADCEEVAAVSQAVMRHDERHDGEFTALHRLFQKCGSLSVDMPADGLTPRQTQALDVLRAVDQLARAVERPYRHWLGDGTTRLSDGIAKKKAWAVVRNAGEHQLSELGVRLSVNPTMRTVQSYHERLAAARGSVPWSRKAVATGTVIPKYEPVETRLESLTALFRDDFVDPEAWE